MSSRGNKYINEVHKNIYKIQLPFPGTKPGPINVYLVLGEKVTLIDTGIKKTFGFLKKAIEETGISFSDIDQIIITHGHIDHYGAAKRVVKESGSRARVAAHTEDIVLIETGKDYPDYIGQRFLKLMGVPFFYRGIMRLLRSGFRLFVDNCTVNIVLNDGDEVIVGDYTGRIISTPGHSKGAISLYLEKENILFVGDNILHHITPNALVMLEQDTEIPVRLSQVEYYNSLSRVEVLDQPAVYTGHGKDIQDIKKTISMYKEQFKERQNKIINALDEDLGNIYQIARYVFPEIRGLDTMVHIYLAVSEVFTHLQVLEKEDRLTTKIKDDLFVVKRL